MLIRRETSADLDTIDAIHSEAFEPQAPGETPIEVGLVRALRDDEGWRPELSLVAEDATGRVVGHVVCTVGSIDGGTGGTTPALGLGPIGVLPEQQGRRVGTALMHAVLGAADALGYPVAVLLGHLDYYPRFGFVTATDLGISPTEPEWGEHFQARRLSTWTEQVQGTFRYARPFDDLG